MKRWILSNPPFPFVISSTKFLGEDMARKQVPAKKKPSTRGIHKRFIATTRRFLGLR